MSKPAEPSGMSVDVYQTARRDIIKYNKFHSRRWENLKSYLF
jgi:hypothetical protein